MAAEKVINYSIQRAPQKCSLIVGRDPSRMAAGLIKGEGIGKVAIVTDDKVPLYAVDRHYLSLQDKGMECKVLRFPSGEMSKHIQNLPSYVSWLTSKNFGKRDCVMGIGGGVVTDIAGFLASGLGRGAKFVSAPTTLLGMVDAGLGGKTGMDTNDGKNLFGAIYQPRFVVSDIDVLKTLNDDQLRSGAAEAIKTGVIGDSMLFDYLDLHSNKLLERETEFFERVVLACAKYKMSVVQLDPEEKLGKREELNFGHTIAHGLEKVSNFKMNHGFAVSIGMAAESAVAEDYGFLGRSRLIEVLRDYGLPVSFDKQFSVDKILEVTKWDKKNVDLEGVRQVKCSIPIAIGTMHPEHSVIVDEKRLKGILEKMVA